MEKKKKPKLSADEKLAIHGTVADKKYNPKSKRAKKTEQIAKDKANGKPTDPNVVLPLAIKALLDDGEKLPEDVKKILANNNIDIKNLRGNLAAYSIVAAFRLLNNKKRPDLRGVDYIAKITGEIAPERKIIDIDPDDAKKLEDEIKDVIKN